MNTEIYEDTRPSTTGQGRRTLRPDTLKTTQGTSQFRKVPSSKTLEGKISVKISPFTKGRYRQTREDPTCPVDDRDKGSEFSVMLQGRSGNERVRIKSTRVGREHLER